MRLLELEQNLIVDTFGESFLLITAEGLMVERIFFKHLELYSDPSVLVLVLNTTANDQEYFMRLLREERRISSSEDKEAIRHTVPKQFNANIGAEERKSMYLEGGIIFGTTRIFVTDLLKELIPLHLVTGILFYRAHAVLRSSLESFIIRSYRTAKSDGFIKAFSDSARAFASGGLGALQRAVSALRVERVRFLPRYHADVISELDKFKPELFEIPVPLKPSVKAMESCLLELIMACVQELKHCCPGSIWEETSLEQALSIGFEKALQRRLEDDRRWNDQLTPKARDLLTDISRLRQLLTSLENDDAKTFVALLKTVRGDQRDLHHNSGWLFTPSAQKIFDIALSKRRQDEIPSKWDALTSVIEELRTAENNDSERSRLRMIIFAEDERICAQLGETLVLNEQLVSSLRVVVGWRADDWDADEETAEWTLILPLTERYHILTALAALQPNAVILYNVDAWIVRHLEVFEANRRLNAEEHDQKALKIYMLMYDNSSEEQRYLTSLKTERDAFDQLFREDASLLVRKADDPESFQPSQPTIEGSHTIVVDLREFRSELPTLLHVRGVHVAPVTLTIGDYVLTPRICVERKATSDLISSLQTGRLYDQCKAMYEFYDRPVILIELENSIRGRRTWRRIGDGMLGRLASLTLHFNRIKLFWATSPSAACDLLLDIKWKRDNPDVEKAVEVGKQETTDAAEERGKVKSWAEYLLLCLPDANATNLRQLTNAATDLRSLCRSTKEELGMKLNSEPWGNRIHEFINRDFRQKQNTADIGASKRGRKRR